MHRDRRESKRRGREADREQFVTKLLDSSKILVGVKNGVKWLKQ